MTKYTVEPKDPIPSTIRPAPKTDWYSATLLTISIVGYSFSLFLVGYFVGSGF